MQTHDARAWTIALALLAVSWAGEVSGAQSEEPEERVGGWPVEYLESPIELREGVGEVADPVTTRSDTARAYYEQGLAFHYLYTDHHAARSFHEALRHDPEMAMAHVGLSITYEELGDRERSRAALEEAEVLAEAVSDRERVRIELRRKAVDAWEGDGDGAAYDRALEAAVERVPDDPELAMLRAENAPSRATRIERYHEVLDRAPGHVGAVHELVHAHEHAGDFEEAARWGEKLAAAAYAVPHGLHMAAHNYPRVGKNREAIRVLEAADSLERRDIEESEIHPSHFGHFRHNLHYLALAYWMDGRPGEAIAGLREAAEAAIGPEDDGDPKVLLRALALPLAPYFRGAATRWWYGAPAVVHAVLLLAGILLFKGILVAEPVRWLRRRRSDEGAGPPLAVRRALVASAAGHAGALVSLVALVQFQLGGAAATALLGLALALAVAGAVAAGVAAVKALGLWAEGKTGLVRRLALTGAASLALVVALSVQYAVIPAAV